MNDGAKPVHRRSLPVPANQLFRPESLDGAGSGGSNGSGGGFASTSNRGRNYEEPATITLIKSIKGLADFGLGTLDSLATEPLRSPRSRNRATAEGQRKAVMPRGAPPRFPWIARRRARDRRRGSDRPGPEEERSRGVIEADITPILHTNAFSSFVHKVRALPNRSANKKAAVAASTAADVDPRAGAAAATRPAETAVIPPAGERKAITSGGAAHAAEASRTSTDRLKKAGEAVDGKRGGFWRESSRDRHRRPGAEEGLGASSSALSTSNGRLTALPSEDLAGNRWGSSSNLTADMASDRSTAEVSERGFLGRLYSKLGVSMDRTPDSDGSDVELSEDENDSGEESDLQPGKSGTEGERMRQARLGPAPSLYHDDFISFQTKASKAGPGAAKKGSKTGGRTLAIRP